MKMPSKTMKHGEYFSDVFLFGFAVKEGMDKMQNGDGEHASGRAF